MSRSFSHVRLAVSALVLSDTVLGRAPKVGGPHTDKVDHDFEVRMSAEWEVIPSRPGDPNQPQALLQDERVALTDLARLARREHPSRNRLGASIGNDPAQGWTFVYFLRAGKKDNAENWNGIPDPSPGISARTGSSDKVVEEVVVSVGVERLEASWKDCTR